MTTLEFSAWCHGQQDPPWHWQDGVIMGKGLSLSGDNIIIQNVHITEINPHVVWDGDAIVIRSSRHSTAVLNKIRLDHVKVSRIGLQMVITSGSGVTMTISSSDFDGHTDFSILCDGHHYWTFLFYGQKTAATMLNNYIHGTFGRSPKAGGENDLIVVVHVANNYWGNNSGHSLDVGERGHVLAEGNYFDNTKEPVVRETKGSLYAFNNLNDGGA